MGVQADDWNLYRTFLAISREGTLSGAARVLGTTQPTIGRQLEALEAARGERLFTRSTRGLRLTSAGRALIVHAERMDAAAAALARVAGGGAEGSVRITTGAQFGVEALPGLLATFARVHPAVQVEVSITHKAEDLLNLDADIAIRLRRPTQQALLARRLGRVRIGLYAHRRYVDAHGAPASIDELLTHRLVGFDREQHLLQAFGPRVAALSRNKFAYRTDNVALHLALLRAGAAIVACHVHVGRADPNLIRILPGEVQFERHAWLVMHADQRRVPRVRALFDHLQQGLARLLA